MSEKNGSIEKWQKCFAQNPMEALDNLLMGHVYMGKLNRNDTDEILFHLFHKTGNDCLTELDEVMRSWFEKYWGTTPCLITRWDEILRDAFSAVIRLNLHKTQAWLLENYPRPHAQVWLRSLYLGPAKDPEANLLRVLALCQHDDSLLPLWRKLCRLEKNRPLHHASMGLLGLHKLPDENGKPPSDLPLDLFSGIVALANAIGKQAKPKKEGKAFFFLKVRALMAHYPHSSQYWTEHFRPLLFSKSSSTAAKWLIKLIPELKLLI